MDKTQLNKVLSITTAAFLTVSSIGPSFALAAGSNSPDVVISASDPDSYLNSKWGTPRWTVSATDDTGLVAIRIKSGDKLLAEKTFNQESVTSKEITYEMTKEEYNKLVLDGGLVKLDVEAEDNEGNISKNTATFKTDIVVKPAKITGLNDNNVFNKFPDLIIENMDENPKNTVVTITDNKTNGTEFNKSQEHKNRIEIKGGDVPEGDYTIKVDYEDEAGNKDSISKVITIDTTGYNISEFNVTGEKNNPENHYYVNNINLKFSLENDALGRYSIKDLNKEKNQVIAEGNIDRNNFSTEIPFTEEVGGEQHLELTVQDNLGNTTIRELKFFADTKKPVIKSHTVEDVTNPRTGLPKVIVTAKEGSFRNNGKFTVRWIKTDGSETITKSKDGVDKVEFDATDFSKVSDGEYSLEIMLEDEAGNKTVENYTNILVIDTEEIQIRDFKIAEALENKYVKQGDLTVGFNVLDKKLGKLKDVKTYLNGVLINETENNLNNIQFNLPANKIEQLIGEDNILNFKVVATDNTIGSSPKLYEKAYILDRKSPVISIDSGAIKEGGFYNIEKISGNKIQIDATDDNLQNISLTISKDGKVINNKTYQEGFTLGTEFAQGDGLYEIVVSATDKAGNVAEKEKLSFTLDSEGPEINSFEIVGDKNPHSDFYFGNVNLNANIIENSKVNYSIYVNEQLVEENEILNNPAIGKKFTDEELENYKTSDGSYTFKIIATDEAGNVSQKEEKIKADFVNPEIKITGVSEGDFLNTVSDITLMMEDDLTINRHCQIAYIIEKNGVEMKNETVNGASGVKLFKEMFSENGTYHISATAIDAGGNLSKTKECTFTVDKSLASIQNLRIVGKANENNWYNDKVTFNAEISDNEILKSYEVLVNGEVIKAEKLTTTSKNVSVDLSKEKLISLEKKNASYNVKINVTDKAGNTASSQITFNADFRTPKIKIESSTSSNNTVNNVSGVLVRVNDDHMPHELAYVEAEIFRNGNSIKKVKEFNVDKLAFSNDLFLPEGRYDVKAIAVDTAGNKGVAKDISFIVDKSVATIDTIKFEGPSKANGWFNGPVTILTTLSDNNSLNSYSVLVNGRIVETSNINSNHKTVKVEMTPEDLLQVENKDARYDVEIRAIDDAGNTTSITNYFYADLKKPNLKILNPDEGKVVNSIPTIQIKAEDDHMPHKLSDITYTVYKNNSLVKTISAKNTIDTIVDKNLLKEEAVYKIKAEALDPAGNSSEKIETTFVLDKSSAEVSDLTLSGEQSEYGWFRSDINLNFNIRDNYKISKYEVFINGKLMDKGENLESKEVSIELTKENLSEIKNPDGLYTIEIKAIDGSGNEVLETKSFFADFEKPVLSYEGMKKENYYQYPSDISFKIQDEHSLKSESKFTLVVEKDGKEIIKDVVKQKNEIHYSKDLFKESGVYTVIGIAEDMAGNKSNEIKEIFTIDNGNPTIQKSKFTGHLSKKNWYNSAITFTFNAKDNMPNIKEVEVLVNNKSILKKTYKKADKIKENSYKIELSKKKINSLLNKDGSLNFEVRVSDFTNNSKVYNKKVYVDFSRQTLKIRGNKAKKHYKNAPEIIISSDEYFVKDNTLNYKVYRDKKLISEVSIKGKKSAVINPSLFKREGDYEIILNAKDGADNKAKMVKTQFTVDKNKPVLSMKGINAEYSNKPVSLTVVAKERYFKTAKVNVKVRKTLQGRITESTIPFKMKSKSDSKIINFADTGTYSISITGEDKVGNKSSISGQTFTVDTKSPSITKRLPKKISGYKDIVSPAFNIHDDYLGEVSVNVKKNGKLVNIPYSKNGGNVTFANFKKINEYDGKYDIEIIATDQAGNSVRDKSSFIVNRFGSQFQVPNIKKGYYNSFNKDIVITATNPSQIAKADLNITLDGEKIAVGSISESSANGQYKTTFTIPKESLKKEGLYNISAKTTDIAGNTVSSKDSRGNIEFAIDKTKPSIITNLSEAKYKEKSKKATVDIKDNMSLKSLQVSLNGKIIENLTEKDIEGKDFSFSFNIPEGKNQKVEIYAKDKAGNIENVSKKVTVDENLITFNIFTILILLVIVIAIILAILLRRKEK